MSLSIIRKSNFSKIQMNRLPIPTIFIANSLMCAICGVLMTDIFIRHLTIEINVSKTEL
ncbi:hypothetical protein GLOIN_2v1675488 [Rhizophagus irregularis DAOM 181602=DAOM 197198]|uniref:Uncharacterized protein n=1 Tax=Rhizophagus irregularis (strain DAOM 181602 / DAOM 197198 / MUCL 43194) TaxID=747089 RepID=A0A2P4PGH3_RHIID|nr:hypothetical protein GLOIN_2v1675488 [Rhizophagus irregularis DAOM 181602=DAOM 197198]POG64475.1 hypothetical protein GLOIN_2v1675488 [Rhizophagus irregularis DAOM 181602=DAOM 197198]|eukprot:XP_025171341.1 hypothetical protein GLOIN_2v1675488 [Rhizophagus irregularis DAOM 181602=DAOM 197198]